MIVSHHHQFIFVAIPKTGTHSVREALRPHLHPRDWEQCLLFVERYFPVRTLAAIPHGHLSCRQAQPILHPLMWRRYFKFCFVRNPYDRFVSFCYFFNRDNARMQRDPLGTMKQIIQHERSRRHILFRPQHEFITDADGNVMVEYVGRFEEMQTHFDRICSRLGLPGRVLSITNASNRKPYQQYFDAELRQMVREFYSQDLRLFGYSFEPSANRAA